VTHGKLTSFEWAVLSRYRRINCANVWFQQDGATAHTANESMTIVRNMFPGHLISRFGDMPWPPRSPDLSMCDFFPLGVFEIACLHSQSPYVDSDLKEAIRQEIRPIDRQLLAHVMDDLKKKKKDLKTASKKTVVILRISFLKLNHLVWHVLSFNFV